MDDLEPEDDFEDEDTGPSRTRRKPVLVIDLQPHQLSLDPDLLELMAQHAADQIKQTIEEVHWRIGPHIVAKTQVKERLPEFKQPHIIERERMKARGAGRKPPTKPGSFDQFGRYRVTTGPVQESFYLTSHEETT